MSRPRIPGAHFELIRGAGHWLPRDPPDQVSEQFIRFLATATAPAPSEGR